MLPAGHAASGRLRAGGGRHHGGGGAPVTAEHVFEVRDLHAKAGGKEVLHGIDLTVRSGEVHVIMGPNGSGKSTLAHALAGHPGYKVLGGSVRIDGVELLTMSPTERARHGLLLAMQQPLEVAGVPPIDLLVAAGADPTNLRRRMHDEADRVELRPEILDRFV